jgi:hypothetical protein
MRSLTKTINLHLLLWLFAGFPMLQSCDKDPILIDYDRGGELKLIHKNDGVNHLAVNETHCLFEHKEALMRYTRWNGLLTNYNWSNSHIGRIVGIGRDIQNKIYVADANYGVGYFENDEYKTVLSKDGLDDFDISGELVTRKSSNVVYNLTNSTQRKSLFVRYGIFTCVASYENRAYVGTDKGLYRYSVHGPEGVFVAGNNQIRDSHIKDLIVHKGQLWVLTNQAVSQKYAENDFHIFDLPDGVFGSKLSICHNQIFVTTNHGVYLLEDDRFIPFDALNDQFGSDETINVVESDARGQLWIGTTSGLYTFTPH